MQEEKMKSVTLRRFVIEYLMNQADSMRRTRAAGRLISRHDASRDDFYAAAEAFKDDACITALRLLAMESDAADAMAADVLATAECMSRDEWVEYWDVVLGCAPPPGGAP